MSKPCNCNGFCQYQHMSKAAIGKCGFFCKLGRAIANITAYTPYGGFGRLVANVLGANRPDEPTATANEPTPGNGGGGGNTHQGTFEPAWI